MPQNVAFGKPLSLIRDSEIENYLLTQTRQLFKTAGLSTSNARVILINDNTLNAFVVGGTTVFVHTGLLLNATHSDQITGVLAHETGHLMGGHILRSQGAYAKMQSTTVATTLLGILAAMASGRADVGLAVMLGGMNTAQGFFSAYQQSEESSADQAALSLLNKNRISSVGFLEMMKIIQQQERIEIDDNISYLRTHPLTKDRITFIERNKNAYPRQDDIAFLLAKAKLYAFVSEPNRTFSTYHDNTDASHYARAIAYFKQTEIQKALAELDILIKRAPSNPYFHELKGQILFETGQIEQAIISYQKAVELLPKDTLIRCALAHALIETNRPDNDKKAQKQIDFILAHDAYLPQAWRLQSILYGRAGQTAEADYALAEYFAAIGDTQQALDKSERAQKTLPPDSVKYHKLEQLQNMLKREIN